MAFTGDCGLMMKMFLMECFCGEHDSDMLPAIACMPCTAAAHCGISSKKCKQCYIVMVPAQTGMIWFRRWAE
jgi:hypothetical protein